MLLGDEDQIDGLRIDLIKEGQGTDPAVCRVHTTVQLDHVYDEQD